VGVAKQKLIIARRSRANRLALVEALNAGITTVHNFAHDTRSMNSMPYFWSVRRGL
jgi:hypothetical protein